MKRTLRRKEQRAGAKSILRLPDLEAAKSAVLNSLSCPDAQRGYRHAIDEFVEWYCSEPRLSFSKTVVVSVPDAPGVAQSRSRYNQPSSRGGAPSCVRSRRLWPPERRFGGWNQTRQRRKEAGRKARQLVECRAGANTLAGARPRAGQGQTRSCIACRTARLRASPPRTRKADLRPPPAAGRALGNRRPTRKGRPRSNHSCSRLGAWPIAGLDGGRRHKDG
jgi:hypothetical protein